MSKKIIDLTGQKFGRLTVLERTKDYITPKGLHQIMWKCQCDCGNIKNIRGDALRNGKNTSCGCVQKENQEKHYNKKKRNKSPIKMSQQEKIEYDELYQYVRHKVMGYDTNQSLSKQMVLRLKGLKVNKFMENRNIEDTANYSYKVILMTFKFCIVDIEKAIRTKNFNSEMQKFNYILAIVENNINNVYIRMQNSAKAKEKAEGLDMSYETNYVNIFKADEDKEDNKKTNKFDDLW